MTITTLLINLAQPPIPIGSILLSMTLFSHCTVLTESWASYQQGRFLLTPAGDSCALVHIYVCIYHNPVNSLWFLTEPVHPCTCMHPLPAWPLLAPMTWLISYTQCNTSCSLTLKIALYLREPQLYKCMLKEFLPGKEDSFNSYLPHTGTRGNSKMNHSQSLSLRSWPEIPFCNSYTRNVLGAYNTVGA